jgi:hypothetical protein
LPTATISRERKDRVCSSLMKTSQLPNSIQNLI